MGWLSAQKFCSDECVLERTQGVSLREFVNRPHCAHFITLCLAFALLDVKYGIASAADSAQNLATSKVDVLPILSYDTDAGVGYGIKSFFLNFSGRSESFDIVLFNSTKGDRWYKGVFSIPDFEMRQGTAYPLALDVTVDYDKWIHYNFFGIGNASAASQEESYTREPLEISAMLSRGITERMVMQAGAGYRVVRNFDFESGSRLAVLPPSENAGRLSYLSLRTSIRYDSRNSFINPSEGLVLQGELERSPGGSLNDCDFTRYGFWIQSYHPLNDSSIVFAVRAGLQILDGSNLPVQVLLPVGGTSTLRGYPQDRFLDRISAVSNAEVRFPFYRRFGGVVGYDLGDVWESVSRIGVARWKSDVNGGLRFYFDTFVVRLDVGLSAESTGFYLNFGQLF